MLSEPDIAISIKVVLILASKLIVELPKGMKNLLLWFIYCLLVIVL